MIFSQDLPTVRRNAAHGHAPVGGPGRGYAATAAAGWHHSLPGAASPQPASIAPRLGVAEHFDR
jgi:hypothetical protein